MIDEENVESIDTQIYVKRYVSEWELKHVVTCILYFIWYKSEHKKAFIAFG